MRAPALVRGQAAKAAEDGKEGVKVSSLRIQRETARGVGILTSSQKSEDQDRRGVLGQSTTDLHTGVNEESSNEDRPTTVNLTGDAEMQKWTRGISLEMPSREEEGTNLKGPQTRGPTQ